MYGCYQVFDCMIEMLLGPRLDSAIQVLRQSGERNAGYSHRIIIYSATLVSKCHTIVSMRIAIAVIQRNRWYCSLLFQNLICVLFVCFDYAIHAYISKIWQLFDNVSKWSKVYENAKSFFGWCLYLPMGKCIRIIWQKNEMSWNLDNTQYMHWGYLGHQTPRV